MRESKENVWGLHNSPVSQKRYVNTYFKEEGNERANKIRRVEDVDMDGMDLDNRNKDINLAMLRFAEEVSKDQPDVGNSENCTLGKSSSTVEARNTSEAILDKGTDICTEISYKGNNLDIETTAIDANANDGNLIDIYNQVLTKTDNLLTIFFS